MFDAIQLDDENAGETPERFSKELVDMFPQEPVDIFFNLILFTKGSLRYTNLPRNINFRDGLKQFTGALR